jgi:hypothetical protein
MPIKKGIGACCQARTCCALFQLQVPSLLLLPPRAALLCRRQQAETGLVPMLHPAVEVTTSIK